eukprot:10943538-Alexandrium_andersonii.AAC.1
MKGWYLMATGLFNLSRSFKSFWKSASMGTFSVLTIGTGWVKMEPLLDFHEQMGVPECISWGVKSASR